MRVFFSSLLVIIFFRSDGFYGFYGFYGFSLGFLVTQGYGVQDRGGYAQELAWVGVEVAGLTRLKV